MNKKHCINCVNCEPMEYTNKIGYTYECRQSDILLTKQEMKEADKCQCYEEDITKGGMHRIPKEIQQLSEEYIWSGKGEMYVNDNEMVDDRTLDMISKHGLMRENKILKEQLSDAKWWLKEILNNSENASDFQKYMREEFGEVIK